MTEEQKQELKERNQKIIDAVIKKAKTVCPDSLALVGIAGSFSSGRYYAKSDLDLLIVINDEAGWKLADLFIEDERNVGHDIYCTSWDNLRQLSEYNDPNIAKLMDSTIVWSADKKYEAEIESLRQKAREKLSAPFSREDFEKAEKQLEQAEHCFAKAMISRNLSDLRNLSGGVIVYVEAAIAMLNKAYYHYGTKDCYEELNALSNRPENLCELIDGVIGAKTAEDIKAKLVLLFREVQGCFDKVRDGVSESHQEPHPVTADSIRGTYEEMFSNWRNKMYLAAETGDRHLAFMSLLCLDMMIKEIKSENQIGEYDALSIYNPDNLDETARAYDALLTSYLDEYNKVALKPKRFEDVDSFVKYYLG